MTGETPIGERVAALETDLDVLKEEVTERIRPNVHAANNAAQAALLRIDTLEKAQQQMNEKVLPEFTSTLDAITEQIRDIKDKVMTRNTDVGWILRILTFVLQGVVTPAALVWLAWLVGQK